MENSKVMKGTLIYLAVINGFRMYFGQAQTCERGPHDRTRFGPSCQYLCHCRGNQCSKDTGQCPDTVECDKGWMGPGCQYVDIAVETTVTSNHLGNTQNIVDGSRTTCSSRNQYTTSAYVTFYFPRKVKISEVHLLFSSSASIQPFSISVVDAAITNICGYVSSINEQKEFSIKCGNPLYGQYINITSEGPNAELLVCEVFVPAGRNLAYGKPAYQSSMFETYYASQAVDGDADLKAWDTCTHTRETTDPWWLLDLQASFMIEWFRIFNRKNENPDDKLNERLKNFRILLSQDNITFRQYYRDLDDNTPIVVNIDPNYNVTARFIKIDLEGEKRVLTLCEVQIFGDCMAGFYGNQCSMHCNYCKDGDCYTDNGICRSCPTGKRGDRCENDCVPGFYGNQCSLHCNYCKDGDCYTSNGICRSCPAGKRGDRCENDCVPGFYGNQCSMHCDYCKDEDCYTVNGFCRSCPAGKRGDRCENDCVPGFYGNQCSMHCDYCKDGDCYTVNGICRSCPAGKRGDRCENDCVPGFYGNQCTLHCDYCRDGDCYTSNGICRSCPAGKRGDRCENDCMPGFYGNLCSMYCDYCKDGDCYAGNGFCRSCPAGKRGDRCENGCSDNYYGSCATKCGHCRDSAVCDKVNGSCPYALCSEGWEGEKCDTGCSSTRYGENCSQHCGHCLNITCDQFTGECFKEAGCMPGWQGNRCDILLDARNIQRSDVTGIVGGSVSAAVALAAIIMAIVIFIKVKRRRKHEGLSSKFPSTRNMSRKMEDNIVYENSTFLDLNNGSQSVQDVRNDPAEGKRITITKLDKEGVVGIKDDSEPYYNIGNALLSGTIQLSKFWDYVKDKFLDDKYFSEEFEKLPSGPQHPTTVAQRPENKVKNRYKQLYAYDANRVLLKPLGDEKNDYINASFINGFSRKKMYIASQGTTKDNVNDFWRMLWQNDVEKIVMLTGLFEGGRHKCELYWPEEEGNISTFGNVAVRLLETDAFADYDIRSLEMSVGNKSKSLTQFHYTAWPDKGVPKAASSMVQFWNRVNRLPTKKPLVVHCSAGIGRTGTYIALDYIVNQAKAEGYVNVSACVSNLRRQRVNLVQTEEQYIFLHEALVEALMLSGTATASDKFPKVYQDLLEVDCDSGKLKLQLEYERLQNEAANHETVYATVKMADEEGIEVISNENEYSAAKKPENRAKNRHDNILPVDRYRVSLFTHVSGGNDYINAVLLPGHRKRQGFILTQTPLTGTITDFWRMIHDFEIKTIIMFGLESSKTHDIGIYWPNDGEVHYGPFIVRRTNEEEYKSYTERTLALSLSGQEYEYDRTVRQFQFKNWADNSDVPGSTESLLKLLEAAEAWQKERDAKPVVVHCLNGAHKSGLYCVMSTVVERLKVERDVAIAQTIKRMRSIRQQIIPNYEQFRFCHECVLQYMKTFETYSNF